MIYLYKSRTKTTAGGSGGRRDGLAQYHISLRITREANSRVVKHRGQTRLMYVVGTAEPEIFFTSTGHASERAECLEFAYIILYYYNVPRGHLHEAIESYTNKRFSIVFMHNIIKTLVCRITFFN